jgi:hypothetical protein
MTKINLPIIFICLLFSIEISAQQATKQKEVLLIGTFHFHNPGADLVKTENFDVLSKQSQNDLDAIADSIKKFSPTKIFVEWDFKKSNELNDLYNAYFQNNYENYIGSKYPKQQDYFLLNEIHQLAFRTAKFCDLKKVHAIDVMIDLRFDKLMKSIEKANQNELLEKITSRIAELESMDKENHKKYSLKGLILELNKQDIRDLDLGTYISFINPAGTKEDFNGANLVSDWYKRNLQMYSLMQKMTEIDDERIVVLLGSSHIAMFKHFIDLDENFKAVELLDIMNQD